MPYLATLIPSHVTAVPKQLLKSKFLDQPTNLKFQFQSQNGGRGTKPTYIFLVIIPLLVIELKATPNGNPSDDFLLEAEIQLSQCCAI